MLAKLASLIKEFMTWTLELSSEPPFGGFFLKKKKSFGESIAISAKMGSCRASPKYGLI
jgi:hypothetical protein